jgi:hypothetical protein
VGRHRLQLDRWNRRVELDPDEPDPKRWEFFYRTPYTEMLGLGSGVSARAGA